MRSGLRLVAAVTFGVLPLAWSCADFSGDEGQPPTNDGAVGETSTTPDVSMPDSAPPPDALPDTTNPDPTDAGVVLVMSDNFDFSCGTWAGVKSSLKNGATPSNSGAAACEVCSTATETGFFNRTIDLPMAPRSGEVLLKAFVRVAAGPGPITLTSVITARDAQVERVVDDKVATAQIVGQYTSVQNANAFLDTNRPAATITVSFEIPQNNCVLFDDITLTFKPK